VAQALESDGVNQGRIGVTGFAEFRPIASNATAAGKAQNRRVEVLILPATIHLAPTAVIAADRQSPSRSRTHVAGKDSASAPDTGSRYNK
jgi:hypothetical protein